MTTLLYDAFIGFSTLKPKCLFLDLTEHVFIIVDSYLFVSWSAQITVRLCMYTKMCVFCVFTLSVHES